MGSVGQGTGRHGTRRSRNHVAAPTRGRLGNGTGARDSEGAAWGNGWERGPFSRIFFLGLPSS